MDKKGKSGILRSLQNRKGPLHGPSHRIRFVYTPKHYSWMSRIEIWLGIVNRKLLKRKNYIFLEEIEESTRRFTEQYNLAAHALRWAYAGVPLTI